MKNQNQNMNETLKGYQFLMADGTIEVVYASNRYEAARIARDQLCGR